MRFAPLVFLLVVACSSSRPEPAASSSSATSSLAPGVTDAFLRAAVGPDRDVIAHRDVLRLLGKPRRTTVETQPNRHVEGATDTLTTFIYPGLAVTVFSGSASPNRFMTDVHISSPAIQTPSGVQVGQRMDDVYRRLGDPSFEYDDGSLGYDLSEMDDATAPQLVVIPDATGERVAAIRYAMFFD